MTITEDPLVAQIENLEDTLRNPEQNEAEWAHRLRESLRSLELALGRQPKPTDKNVQSLELQRREISPGLTRGTKALRREQDSLLQEIDVLASHLERDQVRSDDMPALHQLGCSLVKSLQKFCSKKNNLVIENVMRDTGAGD